MNEYIIFGGDERTIARFAPRVYRFPFISAIGAELDAAALPFLGSAGCKAARCAAVKASVETGGAWSEDGLPLSGKNVTVAVIDTGIAPHLDFLLMRNRIAAFKDFVGGEERPYDDNGHGTAVCGVIAANGAMSCGRYRAAAYKADLAVVKSIGANGEGNALKILEGMQWIYTNRRKFNIRVVNMSFGSAPLEKNDPLSMGAEALWRSGIVVVASAGNLGPKGGTILSPAVNPRIVTVGGARGAEGAAEFSSRGPAGDFDKPDLLAPAENIRSTGLKTYAVSSGTSVAAPQVAAYAALALELRPDLSPDKVKELLIRSCVPVNGCGANVCGAGVIDSGLFYGNLRGDFGYGA